MLLLLLLACNQPPNAPIVAITPEEPTTADDLVAVLQGEATDANGDDVSYAYAWFADGAPTEHTGATVPASATTRGETWKVVVTPSDGKAEGGLGQAEVVVQDTPPTATLGLEPLAPTAGEAVIATAVTEDADGDEVSIAWTWTRDGAAVGLLSGELPEGTTSRGEAWAVTATPSDGELDGEPATLAFTIANALPTLDAVTVAPDAATVADTLVATFEGPDDPDGDAVSVRVRWLVDGAEVADDEVDAGSTATLAGVFAKHQEIVVEATPWDGYDEGATVTSEALVVADTPPALTGATISPDPVYADSVVTCAGEGWSDADGDAAGWRTEWTIDGVVVSTEATLPAGAYARGDTVGCTLLPDDGELTGAAVAAAPVVVQNSPPACTDAAVTIGPDPATQADTLGIAEDGYAGCADADGDALVRVYDWRVDGVSVASEATLPRGLFARGDSVVLETGWSDGYETGAVATSNTLVIANAAPEILSLALSPTEADTSTVLAAAASTFDEEGDAVSLAYAWTVDGVAAGSGATLDGAASFSRGQTVALTVTPSDGLDAGAAASVSLVVGNAAPTAPSVQILPAFPGTDDPLVCGVSAASVDPDGDSVSYTFAWAVGGVAWTGASTTTFPGDTVPASATTNGQTWTCTVTATDGTDAGDPASVDARIGCDADGDGYDATSCGGTDCDDTLSTVHPGAAEVCDSADTDEDCDGLADDADPSLSGSTYYPDADGDSFGDEARGVAACSRPAGYVSSGDDCDDTSASAKPGGTEVCDAADRDEDCDGLADDADPSATGQRSYYVDADGDGYGDEGATVVAACSAPAGHVTNASDCDDGDDTVSPGASEVCADGADNDCDDASYPCGLVGRGYTTDAAVSFTQTTSGYFGSAISRGDFDGDGQTDLVISDYGTSAIRVYYGPLVAGAYADTDDDVTFSSTTLTSLGYGLDGVGDIDGDGDDEIVATAGHRAFLLRGGAMVDEALTSADAFDTYTSLGGPPAAAGDFDGDGYDDFTVGSDYRSTERKYYHTLYLGSGAADPTEVTWTSGISLGQIYNTSRGEDLDGDGLTDHVIGMYSFYTSTSYAGVWALMGDAAPAGEAFSTAGRWIAAPTTSPTAYACLPGDVNLDGYPDVGVMFSPGGNYIFLGPPTTGLTTSSAYITGGGYGCTHGSDTDGDGVDEMVFSGYRYDFPLPSGSLGEDDGEVYFSGGTVTVEAPGDLTDDGYGDIALGYVFGAYGGAAYVFTGGEW